MLLRHVVFYMVRYPFTVNDRDVVCFFPSKVSSYIHRDGDEKEETVLVDRFGVGLSSS